jgi:hypothetical protein
MPWILQKSLEEADTGRSSRGKPGLLAPAARARGFIPLQKVIRSRSFLPEREALSFQICVLGRHAMCQELIGKGIAKIIMLDIYPKPVLS